MLDCLYRDAPPEHMPMITKIYRTNAVIMGILATAFAAIFAYRGAPIVTIMVTWATFFTLSITTAPVILVEIWRLGEEELPEAQSYWEG